MRRTVVEIAAASAESSPSNCLLFARCDDGTIWFLQRIGLEGRWYQIPPVPQDTNDD